MGYLFDKFPMAVLRYNSSLMQIHFFGKGMRGGLGGDERGAGRMFFML